MNSKNPKVSCIKDQSDVDQIVEEHIIKPNGENTISRYTKGRFLGKGGFARVYEFINLDTKRIFAAKIVKKATLIKARARQKLMSEIKIHSSLKHQNIVGFDHFFEDVNNVYLLLELCPNQTMSELLRRRKRITELEAQCYLLQIIAAMKYIHSKKVIHRDLKIGNLFINEKMEIKLGDFGLACKLEYDGQKKKTICGTPNYIAPEVLEGKSGHSFEVDIWSLGVILYTLLIGKPPFETDDVHKTYRLIKMNAYSFPDGSRISEQAKSLITRILKNDPERRPDLDEILQHEFFHMANCIPKILPVSTLAVPPSESYLRQFTNIKQNVEKTLPETAPINSENLEIRSPKKSHTQRPMSSLGKTDKNIDKSQIYVEKWIDYSSKFGVGYILSNGCSGVYFNDETKILTQPNSQSFYYIETTEKRKDAFYEYSLEEYPETLSKKVRLLDRFTKYLDPDSSIISGCSTNFSLENPPPYIKKWAKSRRAVMFRLSNKIIQVVFQDHSQIILSVDSKSFMYINKSGEKALMQLSTALESQNEEIVKRLKYVQKILNSLNSQAIGDTGSPPIPNS
ncbi:unnamed protein product [Blepharisma stoltei]|uniref:Serine/threonine-protein kinase PLK n=1 Tax=Blepharisma stoltei TaxID=1481888 RepID=A0AAU9KA13_9CILI|nr:unnamed protein product [Blepharisma stoltei]